MSTETQTSSALPKLRIRGIDELDLRSSSYLDPEDDDSLSEQVADCFLGVVYGQTIVTPTSFSLLKAAVSRLLESSLEQPTPKILWSMQYTHTLSQSSNGSTEQGPIVSDVLPSLVLEDDVVRDVHRAWEVLVGEERGDGFMTFKQREESGADDEAA